MITREALTEVDALLEEYPAVVILGPRQIGKTTLAVELARLTTPDPVYLDLENPADQARLSDPERYFEMNKGRLIMLDEIQHSPGLFKVLRGVIDKRRREGLRTKQFLLLGSASIELLRQSSESLAGRVAFKELPGFSISEMKGGEIDKLWVRGGFPDSFLAKDDKSSLRWRSDFITTYLEREIPQFGPRIPAATLRRLWTMVAHSQGTLLNVAQLGASLDVAAPTARRYLDLLEDLLLIRKLSPWSVNAGKRLVKSPKVYIRDSGIAHALLSLETINDILGHPVVGASWEGFVIENLVNSLPPGATSWFYRTSAGAELDLVIERGTRMRWAIEIKRSSAPVLSKGFHIGCQDIGATGQFVVYPGTERFPVSKLVMAMPLLEMKEKLRNMG